MRMRIREVRAESIVNFGTCDGIQLIMSRFSHHKAAGQNCEDDAGFRAFFEESFSICVSTIRINAR